MASRWQNKCFFCFFMSWGKYRKGSSHPFELLRLLHFVRNDNGRMTRFFMPRLRLAASTYCGRSQWQDKRIAMNGWKRWHYALCLSLRRSGFGLCDWSNLTQFEEVRTPSSMLHPKTLKQRLLPATPSARGFDLLRTFAMIGLVHSFRFVGKLRKEHSHLFRK